MTPANLPGGQTWYFDPPDFLERNIFWYTGQLILRKSLKLLPVATSRQIFRLKCTKFDFGRGSTPDPYGGAYSATPDPLAGFKGVSSKCGSHHFDLQSKIVQKRLKVKVRYMVQCCLREAQKCFTISEVAADCHELMILQRIMRPSIVRTSEQLDLPCS